ncbi:MAG TPA: ATP-binding cassette domain-containing protein [Desulfobacterales bacterium]|nr:ATP-binding cassette domain-containing protein [Desulfobacterales bacterium]
MQSEVMKHFGLIRSLPRAGYFETAQQRRVFEDIKIAIRGGQLLALVGLVGCGKTTTLHRLTEALKDEREILVSQSLAVDKHRINLGTLMLALFYDLVTEKDFKVRIPVHSAAPSSGDSASGSSWIRPPLPVGIRPPVPGDLAGPTARGGAGG